MADVKWIKIAANIFDNRKIRMIESLPDGDSIIVIWVKLLCLAGNINDCGMIYFTKDIPYTDQMLSTQFNRPLSTIQLALNTFQQFGMIEIVDNFLHVCNWEKYQNIEGLDRVREQTRNRVAKFREKQKEIECNVTVTQCNAIEEDKNKNKNINNYSLQNNYVNYQEIVDLYHSICKSYPKVTKLSDKRKKAIKARLNTYTVDDFKKVFEKAEASSWLRGKNPSNWIATFDWIICDSNMAKVLDGNYDDKPKSTGSGAKQNSFNSFPQRETDYDKLEKQLLGVTT